MAKREAVAVSLFLRRSTRTSPPSRPSSPPTRPFSRQTAFDKETRGENPNRPVDVRTANTQNSKLADVHTKAPNALDGGSFVLLLHCYSGFCLFLLLLPLLYVALFSSVGSHVPCAIRSYTQKNRHRGKRNQLFLFSYGVPFFVSFFSTDFEPVSTYLLQRCCCCCL